ncbi:hypothetical protein [Deinococcus cellulosilyticus]|uniref:Uncharacterized protein n=1 Tax=Deinococcus cellulosilyticus (strain DSM 18568 / NBRC 106333 / KACC 11606 / 5516J-15) TaxID=1223518 RepID=A0A511N8B8_DEIC1|nr:hypothetical protein [Deinococcus cellulosilyticus]GEM48716.1 hypothetical protein DC3_43510 [Deinococcus cellulosilyticus NBRC 106333 = KACC 11606]
MTLIPVMPHHALPYTIQTPEDLRNVVTPTRSETERFKLYFAHPRPRRGAYPMHQCWITAWPHHSKTVFMFDPYEGESISTLEQIKPYLDTLTALGWELKQVTEWKIQGNITARVQEPVFIGALKRRTR